VYYWQESVESGISSARRSFSAEVNSFCENYDLCSERSRSTTRQLAASAEIQQLSRDIEQLETGAHIHLYSPAYCGLTDRSVH